MTIFVNGGANEGGALFWSAIPDVPLTLGPTCNLHLDMSTMMLVDVVRTDSIGRWTKVLLVPNTRSLVGARGAMQCALGKTSARLGFDMSNGLYFTFQK